MRLSFLPILTAILAESAFADGELDYKIDVELVVGDLVAPLYLTSAPGDDETRYIVDQSGYVQILRADGSLDETPFFDIEDKVVLSDAFDERGLLGFTFHPSYEQNGKIYVHYSGERTETNICRSRDNTIPLLPEGCPHQHRKIISEFTRSASNANEIDITTERVLLSMEWPGRKHVGGGLEFGNDGFLYIGVGDGGIAHGPEGIDSAITGISEDLFEYDLIPQDLTNMQGKMLRIDVDTREGDLPYGIPSDNPFVSRAEYPSEIYAWGFRNPYRISVDRDGGSSVYMSATGETIFEATYKIDGPGNFGWATKEGTRCITRVSPLTPPETISCTADADCPSGPAHPLTCGSNGFCECPSEDAEGYEYQDPMLEYVNFNVLQHNETKDLLSRDLLPQPLGRASLGGYIYRGEAIPWLQGKFIQADFSQTFLDGLVFIASEPTDGGLWDLELGYMFDASNPDKQGYVKSIGEDGKGELYVITGAATPTGIIGRIWKIVDATEYPAPTPAPTDASTSGSAGMMMIGKAIGIVMTIAMTLFF